MYALITLLQVHVFPMITFLTYFQEKASKHFWFWRHMISPFTKQPCHCGVKQSQIINKWAHTWVPRTVALIFESCVILIWHSNTVSFFSSTWKRIFKKCLGTIRKQQDLAFVPRLPFTKCSLEQLCSSAVCLSYPRNTWFSGYFSYVGFLHFIFSPSAHINSCLVRNSHRLM